MNALKPILLALLLCGCSNKNPSESDIQCEQIASLTRRVARLEEVQAFGKITKSEREFRKLPGTFSTVSASHYWTNYMADDYNGQPCLSVGDDIITTPDHWRFVVIQIISSNIFFTFERANKDYNGISAEVQRNLNATAEY